jgi:hypothetical protein
MSVTLAPGASLGRIAEIVRNAVIFGSESWELNPARKRPDGSPSQPGLLPEDRDVVELFTMLAERRVPYLLVGGIAMLRYVEGRNTEDIGLLMSQPSLGQLPEIIIDDRNEFFSRGHLRSVRVDVLLTANTLFAEVRERFGTAHRFAEVEVPTATPEGLILLKLYALPSLYRQGQFDRVSVYESDIASLLHRHHCEVNPLFERLRPHMLESDLRELRGIVKDIQARIARFEDYGKS